MRLQVDEMEKAVDVAEQSMARFNLTPQVVAARRKWVKDTRKKVWQQLHRLSSSSKYHRCRACFCTIERGALTPSTIAH